MRRFYLVFIIFFSFQFLKSQVGIGTSSPNSSSMLDVYSTSKGILYPSYQLASLTDATSPIQNPANGLIIFNTGGTYSKGLYYWYIDSWYKLFLNSDVPHSMVLSTLANVDSHATFGTVGSSVFIFSTSTSPNKFSTFGLLGNTIIGANFNKTTGVVTLPAGKYKLDFSVDVVRQGLWNTGENPLNPTNQRIYYLSFHTYLLKTDGTPLGEASQDNEILPVGGSFATFYSCFYINLTEETTFSFYMDFASDSQKANFRPRTSADLQIYELKD